MDDALQIENLSLSLNGNTILDDISLTLKRGAFAALCGRNGAGKSQLLRCIKGEYSLMVKSRMRRLG